LRKSVGVACVLPSNYFEKTKQGSWPGNRQKKYPQQIKAVCDLHWEEMVQDWKKKSSEHLLVQ